MYMSEYKPISTGFVAAVVVVGFFCLFVFVFVFHNITQVGFSPLKTVQTRSNTYEICQINKSQRHTKFHPNRL